MGHLLITFWQKYTENDKLVGKFGHNTRIRVSKYKFRVNDVPFISHVQFGFKPVNRRCCFYMLL